MKRNTILKIIAAVVLVAAIVGLGFFAYNTRMAQGMPFDPQQFEDGTFPMTPRMGMGYGSRGFNPGGFLAPLLMMLLVFGAIRFFLWGRPRRWHHMHGPRGMYKGAGYGYCEEDVPPMFDEWHRRAHEQESKADPKSPDSDESMTE